MSADSIHTDVEKWIKAMRNVYDYDDFCSCINGNNVDLIKIATNDIFELHL